MDVMRWSTRVQWVNNAQKDKNMVSVPPNSLPDPTGNQRMKGT